MKLALDHIVHFIQQHPNVAVEEWVRHGFHAVMGGSHEKWGTYNSLLYVGDAYIEYLAIENAEIAAKSNNPLISQLIKDLTIGEGIGQICFRTNNMLDLKVELENKGCETYPIFNGSRKRQDGSTIRWKMLFIKNSSSLPYPFFIEWEQEDSVRMKELKELAYLDDRLVMHSIFSIQVAVNDCQSAAKHWAKLFHFTLTDIYIDERSSLKKAILKAGSFEIHFCQPLNEDSPLHNILYKKGERPFEINFAPVLDVNSIFLFSAEYN
ncbi:VOC family protein [Cytobacillus massiliigabonensis]|uniref:VOC family protein n=1 Tax=Cytobacillus massiliigabonensis TaxID=1871011 RepID=UPI000C85A367|nr:VOC family protein [Cytobacillus massiliigabonensis]